MMPKRPKRSRTAAAAVEFAIVAPVVLTLFFASIEFSRANMIRNFSQNAAMEGARAAILPGSDGQDAINEATELISIVGIQNATVTIDPPILTPTTPQVTVTVTVPLLENSLPMSKFVLGETIRQTVTLTRELNQ